MRSRRIRFLARKALSELSKRQFSVGVVMDALQDILEETRKHGLPDRDELLDELHGLVGNLTDAQLDELVENLDNDRTR